MTSFFTKHVSFFSFRNLTGKPALEKYKRDDRYLNGEVVVSENELMVSIFEYWIMGIPALVYGYQIIVNRLKKDYVTVLAHRAALVS